MPPATRTALHGAIAALATGIVMALASPALGAPVGSTFLVSRPDGNGPVVAPTDNDSRAPIAVSQEGRYVAFVSAADGFAPGANPSVLNVFVRDTVANTTTLVSRSDGLNGAGANADVDTSSGAKIAVAVEPGSQAPDGPHDQPHVLVAFASAATNLVDHDEHAIPPTGGKTEIWLRDVTAGTTYLVSRLPGLTGEPANGRSTEPSLTAGPEGALVAFTSDSTNFGPGLAGSVPKQVYMRDVTNGVTDLVSCANGNCASGPATRDSLEPSIQFVQNSLPQVCGGGPCALVAFMTTEPTIAPSASGFDSQVVLGRAVELPKGTGLGGFKGGFSEWFTQSAHTNEFANESVPGNANSWAPEVLEDGRSVAFLSQATNLEPEAPIAVPGTPAQVYFHFNGGGAATVLLSEFVSPLGARSLADSPLLDFSVAASSSPQGTHLAFDTGAGNLGVSHLPGQKLAYENFVPHQGMPVLLDRASGEGGAPGDGSDSNATLSGDGSAVAFVSSSRNLGVAGGSEFQRVYLRRLAPDGLSFEPLQLVSRPSGTGSFSPGGKEAHLMSSATSADGRFVAFESTANDLSGADDDDVVNVFVRDTVKGTTTLVSRANGAGGAGADESSELRGISENGQRVLFTTAAENFGFGGGHGPYAYVRDIGAQTTTLASRVNGPSGKPVAATGTSLSGDGNRVAFATPLTIDPEADNSAPDHLYVRDLAAQMTTFVDRDDGVEGNPASEPAEESALDRKGDRVAWVTRAVLFGAGARGQGTQRRIYLRDIDAGTTVLVSRADGAEGAEANAEALRPALNADGTVVAFESSATNLGPAGGRSVWVRRLNANRTELVSRAAGTEGAPADAPAFAPSIDAAGDRVAFVTNSGNLGAVRPENDGAETLPGAEAYVRDLTAHTTELVSRVDGKIGAPARPSRETRVSISASGDCVAFSGTGANYTDVLSGADFPQVRERVLRGNCGPETEQKHSGTEAPPAETPEAAAVLRGASVAPSRFLVGAAGGGTEISFVLDRPSRVTLSFRRAAAPTFAGRPRRAGKLVFEGHRGRNRLHFSGILHGRALTAGRYRWSLTPLHGSAASGSFVVLRRRNR